MQPFALPSLPTAMLYDNMVLPLPIIELKEKKKCCKKYKKGKRCKNCPKKD